MKKVSILAFIMAIGAAFAFKAAPSHRKDTKDVYTKVSGICSSSTTTCSNVSGPACVANATYWNTSGCSNQELSYTHQP